MLFGLRFISGLLLAAWLLALFVMLWRSFQSAASQAEVRRRVYGQLLVLLAVDGTYTRTGEAYPLYPLTSLGRAPTNTIVLDDSFSSSEHAVIALREGRWWLEDRRSRNGTLLNGEPVTEALVVTDGDILSIGNTHLQVSLDERETIS